MSQRQAVTKAIATRYRRAGRAEKGAILDELSATAGWHRVTGQEGPRAALIHPGQSPGEPLPRPPGAR